MDLRMAAAVARLRIYRETRRLTVLFNKHDWPCYQQQSAEFCWCPKSSTAIGRWRMLLHTRCRLYSYETTTTRIRFRCTQNVLNVH